jgi:hypothetical protein
MYTYARILWNFARLDPNGGIYVRIMYMHTYTCTLMYTCIHWRIYMWTCAHVQVCTCVHIYTYVHGYIILYISFVYIADITNWYRYRYRWALVCPKHPDSEELFCVWAWSAEFFEHIWGTSQQSAHMWAFVILGLRSSLARSNRENHQAAWINRTSIWTWIKHRKKNVR